MASGDGGARGPPFPVRPLPKNSQYRLDGCARLIGVPRVAGGLGAPQQYVGTMWHAFWTAFAIGRRLQRLRSWGKKLDRQ
jgi:hypothetical protein